MQLFYPANFINIFAFTRSRTTFYRQFQFIVTMAKRKASTDIKSTTNNNVTEGESIRGMKKPRTAAAAQERANIVRDVTPPKIALSKAIESQSYINIVSANVAGLRGVLNNENKRAYLSELLSKTKPDVFCIQEHKLQDMHLTNLEKDLVCYFTFFVLLVMFMVI